MILLKVLNHKARLPEKGSIGAAGLDLASCERVIIGPKQSAIIKTGLAVSVGVGNVGLIWARSKLGAKYNIQVQAGVIDADYTGEVMVSLYNGGEMQYIIEPGDRIAQLLSQPVNPAEYTLVKELKATERGAAGINSIDERR